MELLDRLANTPLAYEITDHWFPWIESLHVVAMATVAGTIFMVDSRLVGLAFRRLTFTHVSTCVLPWTWFAFSLAVITGILMFISNPLSYYPNTAFRVKLVLLLAAGLNMLIFQKVTFRSATTWDAVRAPAAARAAGFISMSVWACVIGFARWIGFSM
jgi:hypothetical protein